ncbi:MAG: hypothetical protein QOG48_2003, partial [Verrucomicrobiota bacterium]
NQQPERYARLGLWFVGALFAIFAFRSFLWLYYIDGAEWKIQSPNNLGDLALHLTYIKNFASGVHLWPDNPIYIASKMRYPAGVDLFNALPVMLHVDLAQSLVWIGLLGSLGTFYALWRWGGEFTVAGFLFNGGVAGFQYLRTFEFKDYQGVNDIAWKSIPLSMFVTQRGWLYAFPVGLLLLWHWREKFYSKNGGTTSVSSQEFGTTQRSSLHVGLPFAAELALYASMPLFHVHTFLALSCVLVFLFAGGDAAMRRHIALLIGGAFIPATFFVWLVSDNFHAGSMIQWSPGWVRNDHTLGRSSFIDFWFVNFGILMPLVLALVVMCLTRFWKTELKPGEKFPEDAAFLLPAIAIFLAGILFKFAPWEWDNLKLMVWSYFLVLPFLWTNLISKWSEPVRVGVCIALFGSGFVSLFGGLAASKDGFGLANRGEVDGVCAGAAVLPEEARFASYPTYNHPLLLNGRKVVMGYPGHLWTQGFDYGKVENILRNLMNGAPNWREAARVLGVRYLFWGREEKINYATSHRPWETVAPIVSAGDWGAIYDLNALEPNVPRSLGDKPTPP